MQKRILLFLYKWVEKINLNSSVALNKIRQHLYFMDYEDKESDVYIVTFLKSGTTWMQVILYQLLTDGNMDFDHIYDVSPWPRNEAQKNNNADEINKISSPRILKSHDSYDFFDKDCKAKFIHVYRDGKDVSVSLFHHNKNYRDADLTFEENFEEYFIKEDNINWFKFNNEWFKNENNLNVFYVSYESLKTNFEQTVHTIANFLEVELTNEILDRVKTYASFDYMKANEGKFGVKPPAYTKLVFNQFIRNGKIGEGATYMTSEQMEMYNIKYNKFIKPFMKKSI